MAEVKYKSLYADGRNVGFIREDFEDTLLDDLKESSARRYAVKAVTVRDAERLKSEIETSVDEVEKILQR